MKPEKDYGVAMLLCFFLGGLGAHWFYLEHMKKGLFSVLFVWTFVPAILATITFIYWIFMGKEKWYRQYSPEAAQSVPGSTNHPPPLEL